GAITRTGGNSGPESLTIKPSVSASRAGAARRVISAGRSLHPSAASGVYCLSRQGLGARSPRTCLPILDSTATKQTSGRFMGISLRASMAVPCPGLIFGVTSGTILDARGFSLADHGSPDNDELYRSHGQARVSCARGERAGSPG